MFTHARRGRRQVTGARWRRRDRTRRARARLAGRQETCRDVLPVGQKGAARILRMWQLLGGVVGGLVASLAGCGLAGADTDWAAVQRQYEQLRQSLTVPRPPYETWLRTPQELWVYDNRVEIGIGAHQLPQPALDWLQDLGICLVRHTLYWNLMEPTESPGQYAPEYLAYWDELTQRCRARGIELLVVVHGNPPGVGWLNREESYRRFARFMGDMARRYLNVRLWELWNEMDGAFTDLFGAGVDPPVPMLERGKLYAQMLKLAYPAIKQANPQAVVLTGGMTDWTEFPRGIYQGGGRLFFDYLNLHTYGVPVDWSVVIRGAQLREVMAEFGDRTRPLWNTELGIDAGNLVQAWGFPHDRGEEDGPAFDRMHLEQWQRSIQAARDTALYAKVLPYQFAAGNECLQDVLGSPDYAARYLPAGRTIADYGFGIMRADGISPRPTCQWLQEAQLNAAIRAQPTFRADVTVSPAPAGRPVGFQYDCLDDALVIRDVPVELYTPTRIVLVP